MEYISAYALCSLSGKAPDEAQVSKVIEAGNGKVDKGKIKQLFDAIKGRKIEDLIKKGYSKVTSGAPAPAPAAKKQVKQQKKVEKVVEKKVQPEPPAEDEDFGAGDLFGGDF